MKSFVLLTLLCVLALEFHLCGTEFFTKQTFQKDNIFVRARNYILRCPELGEIFSSVCELFFCTVKTFPEGIVLKKCVMARENLKP